mmetsp:Transcript_6224/g.11505  ORF Transcript_6224/g.11505 Transcript_6224/m.11505 type:complete len:93 (-) Transcript_6224:156-434(-)
MLQHGYCPCNFTWAKSKHHARRGKKLKRSVELASRSTAQTSSENKKNKHTTSHISSHSRSATHSHSHSHSHNLSHSHVVQIPGQVPIISDIA